MQTWYYLRGSEQIGPISEKDLVTALNKGTLEAGTLVWCEGMGDWLPLRDTPLNQYLAGGGRASMVGTGGAGASFSPSGAAGSDKTEAGKRPASVTAFGILNIVFGCKTLLCLPISIPLMFVGFSTQPELFPEWYIVAVLVLNPLVFFNGILELSSGIGLLKCRRWARKAALTYGVFALILGLCGVLIEGTYFITRIGQASDQTAAAIGGAVGGVVGGVIALVYPVLLLIFMQKPAAVDACVE